MIIAAVYRNLKFITMCGSLKPEANSSCLDGANAKFHHGPGVLNKLRPQVAVGFRSGASQLLLQSSLSVK